MLAMFRSIIFTALLNVWPRHSEYVHLLFYLIHSEKIGKTDLFPDDEFLVL